MKKKLLVAHALGIIASLTMATGDESTSRIFARCEVAIGEAFTYVNPAVSNPPGFRGMVGSDGELGTARFIAGALAGSHQPPFSPSPIPSTATSSASR